MSWVGQNLLWEILVALIGTATARVYRWTAGRKLTTKKEFGFWAAGLLGGTIILALINTGLISPIVKKATEPSLSVDEVQLSLSDQSSTSHQVAFMLTIFNEGAPSVIRNWKLKVSGPDREDIFPPAALLTRGVQTNFSPSGEKTILDKKNSFVEDAGNYPIERGGKRTGFIIFVINDTSRAYLESHETKYDLSFWDITGKKYDYPNMTLPAPARK